MWAMLLLLCPALGSAALAPHPTGTLLWSSVSEAGMGRDFGSALLLPSGDVLLSVPGDCPQSRRCPDHLGRLRPSTGALAWSVPQLGAGPWSFALGGDQLSPLAVAWTTAGDSLDVRVHDVVSGQVKWEQDGLPLEPETVPFAVSSAAVLCAGAPGGTKSPGTSGVLALATSAKDGTALLHRTVATDNTTNSGCANYGQEDACQRHGCAWIPQSNRCQRIDWFARSVTLAGRGSPAGELALIATGA